MITQRESAAELDLSVRQARRLLNKNRREDRGASEPRRQRAPARIDSPAEQIMSRQPRLTHAQAAAEALRQDPSLYSEYSAAHARVGDGPPPRLAREARDIEHVCTPAGRPISPGSLLMGIPMMSISHSDLMPIRAERSDAGLSQCEIVIDIPRNPQPVWPAESFGASALTTLDCEVGVARR